ncbi:MAG TPA: hypothetical protein VIK91_02825 [Nannocystis sp.]
MSGGKIRPVLARVLACGLFACGGGASEAGEGLAVLPPRPGSTRASQAEAARALVDALLAAPGAPTLLAVLGQGHAVARELLGRHTLQYEAEFSLVPAEPARPVVDAPVLLEQKVKDTLELRWAAGPGEPVRFYLSQRTDKHRGREVMVVDEQVYTRMLHRGWHVRPLDVPLSGGDLHLRWLDEAQRAVHDVVELAAPALSVTAREEGDVVQVGLSLGSGSASAPASALAPGRAWRERAEITGVEGTLTLDRATGLWQQADVRVTYTLRDVQDRLVRGETHLTGAAARAPELELHPPQDAKPLPERVRYEAERRRLLEGLAGT